MNTELDPADILFSNFVREEANWMCKLKFKCRGIISFKENKSDLHCCHYHSRKKRPVRFGRDNTDSGCWICHDYYDKHMPKEEKEAWKKNQIGVERFRALNVRANHINMGLKMRKEDELEYVKELIKESKKHAS